MVSTAPLITHPIPQPVGEKRVVLRSLDWRRYQAIKQLLGSERNARLTYAEGILEITVPLEIHEFSARLIERFVFILAEELAWI